MATDELLSEAEASAKRCSRGFMLNMFLLVLLLVSLVVSLYAMYTVNTEPWETGDNIAATKTIATNHIMSLHTLFTVNTGINMVALVACAITVMMLRR